MISEYLSGFIFGSICIGIVYSFIFTLLLKPKQPRYNISKGPTTKEPRDD